MSLAELARRRGLTPDTIRRPAVYARLRAAGMPARLAGGGHWMFPRAASLAWLAGAKEPANDDVPLDDVLAQVRAELQAEYGQTA